MKNPLLVAVAPAGVSFIRSFRLGLTCLLAACLLTRLRAADPAPPLREQLAAAEQDHDDASVSELCRRLLAESPGDKDLIATMIAAEISQKDFASAQAAVDEFSKTATGADQSLAKEWTGEIAEGQDRPADAFTAWSAALLLGSNERRAGLLEKIARLREKRHEWDEAVQAWQQLVATGKRNQPSADDLAAGHAHLALALLNVDRIEDAIREMEEANRDSASEPTVKKEFPRFERMKAQLAALHHAPAPDDPSAMLDRAVILYDAAAYSGALKDADAAITAGAKDWRSAQVLEGLSLWKLSRDDDAIRLRVAKSESPNGVADQPHLDRLRKSDITIATEKNPDKIARAYASRAVELLALNQIVLALADARQAVEAAPHSADAGVILAAALLRNGQSAEALAAARRATELDARSADAWAMLGRIEQERAEFPAAIADLSRALSLHEDIKWLARREACLRAVGRTADADRDQNRLLQLQPPPST